jgi:hypothetical protein
MKSRVKWKPFFNVPSNWVKLIRAYLFSSVIMRHLLISLSLLISFSAFAARPFMTDDARLTTAGSCQLESWTRVYKNSREQWALPACNLTGNFEITAGGGRSKNTGEPGLNDYVLQGKTLFRELNTNGYGWGLAVGHMNHPNATPGPNSLGNTYAYVPLSISTRNDKVIYHTNVGWMRDKATHENRMTYGFGAEIQTSERMMLIAETFGDHKAKPYWQTGARYTLIPNQLQIDATVGQQYNGTSNLRWISFGLRFFPESIF